MGRGYIYHFTTDPYNCGSINANCFVETDGVVCDYFEDVNKDMSRRGLEYMQEWLERAGFVVNKNPKTESGNVAENAAFSIAPMSKEALEAAKREFFRPLYTNFQSQVAALTLDDFAKSNGDAVYNLQTLLDDDFGDAICVDEGYGWTFKTLHRAIRELAPDTEYFVSNTVVYMH